MMPFRFTSSFAYRLYRPLLRAMPQRILDRFDEHLLKYAIADPHCAAERPQRVANP